MQRKLIDPFERGKELRPKVRKYNRILCADFTGTVQAEDIRKRNDLIQDVDIERYCYRAKINVKDFDDNERAKKGVYNLFDFSDEKAIKEALKMEFDIPLWFLRGAGDELKNIKHYNLPLILQLKGCNFHDGTEIGGCTFCFVDNKSNSGEAEGGVWISPENFVNTFQAVSDKLNIHVLRVSGGEPTLVLDFILDVLREIDKRGLINAQMQFDTNLSTGRLIEHFVDTEIYQPFILENIAVFKPKILAAFKGTDEKGIQNNTQTSCILSDQIHSLKMLIYSNLDVFIYVYNPNPNLLRSFTNILDKEFEDILPRIHIGKINEYEVTKCRLSLIALEQNRPYEEVLGEKLKEWKENYEQSCEIMNDLMMHRYGVGYKEIERPSVKIKIKNSDSI